MRSEANASLKTRSLKTCVLKSVREAPSRRCSCKASEDPAVRRARIRAGNVPRSLYSPGNPGEGLFRPTVRVLPLQIFSNVFKFPNALFPNALCTCLCNDASAQKTAYLCARISCVIKSLLQKPEKLPERQAMVLPVPSGKAAATSRVGGL